MATKPRTFRILMAGYGTVGRALHAILEERGKAIREEHGVDLRLVGVARRDRIAVDPKGLPAGSPNALPWKSGAVFDLLGDCEADVFVDVTPTNVKTGQPGLAHVRAAFHEGLPVVLANKGPLAVAYAELVQRAEQAGVPLRFEATVAGCVPTLNAARYAFAGDQIERVDGILNGTTNFILTRMAEEGSDFEQALKEAQSLGYAEADPAGDLSGLDAAAKVVILGNAILGLKLTLDQVDVQGIQGVTRQAVDVAAAHGFRIKLIAEASRDGTARVGPRLVRRGSPLDVPGALNAVRFRTSLAGTVTHVGHGAGGRVTAAAVLSDILDVARLAPGANGAATPKATPTGAPKPVKKVVARKARS